MTSGAEMLKPFAPGRPWARPLTMFLGLTVALNGFLMLSSLYQVIRIQRFLSGGAESPSILPWQTAMTTIHELLLYPTAVLFLIWMYRAYRNLPALGARDLRYSPGWAVSWFFAPFLNLYRPYQVMTEIWKASDPRVARSDYADRQGAAGSPAIGWWWAFWLLSGLPGVAAYLLSVGTVTWESALQSNWWAAGYHLMDGGAALLAIRVISKVEARQQAKSRNLPATM